MLKKIFVFILLFITAPAFSGELENALSSKDYVYLYIYTPWCKYCTQYTPIYNKLSKMYDKNYAFVKLDATKPYGSKVSRSFNNRYVPAVYLINSKTKKSESVDIDCMFEIACTEKAIQKFRK
jgi:thioredoxin-like negative regulator of GroEL